MFTIRQNGDGWELVNAAGAVLATGATYDEVLRDLAGRLQLATETSIGASNDAEDGDAIDGLLPERWTSSTGVAFQESPDDERDFTECEWTWRDPTQSLVPLMFQNCTDFGHFGAVLAGFVETITDTSGTVFMAGRFYDSDAGEALRDMLLGGRRFGVSVDPGVDPDVGTEVVFVCTNQDEDGFCLEGVNKFMRYEIIGLTATPFPGFPLATIELEQPQAPALPDAAPVGDTAPVAASFAAMAARPVVASGGVCAAPIVPPAAWFAEPEPALGDPRMVEQPDGSLAVPLTITDDGQVYGHVARWGQCHTGYLGACVTPPESSAGCPGFNLATVRCDDGSDAITGPLIMGMDHPALTLRASAARDAYAHTGTAWADVHATDGELGPWVAGALRPDVTPLQLRVLRASTLSGDWREDERTGAVELIATLAVNVPGFPIARQAIAASGMRHPTVQMQARQRGTDVVAVVAAGMVQPCPECAKRARELAAGGAGTGDLARVLAVVQTLERRTRHLAPAAAEALAARIRR